MIDVIPCANRFYETHPDLIDDFKTVMISSRFKLSEETKKEIRSMTPQFGFQGFGEVVYYRTYSRRTRPEFTAQGKIKRATLKAEFNGRLLDLLAKTPDNGLHSFIASFKAKRYDYVMSKCVEGVDYTTRQENWADTIIRVIEGCFTYRKDHMIKNGLSWNDDEVQPYAREMAISAFNMEWLPSGRGLWASGSEYSYRHGSACLTSCAATHTNDLAFSATWLADMLMCGSGVGFRQDFTGEVIRPDKSNYETIVIPDNREGWAYSIGLLIGAYVPHQNTVNKFPIFDYSKIRKYGEPLKGFGGISSGPDPLIKLHKRMGALLDMYVDYQAATDRSQQLEAIAQMVLNLREEDFFGKSNDDMEFLLRQIRGQPVVSNYTDYCQLVKNLCGVVIPDLGDFDEFTPEASMKFSNVIKEHDILRDFLEFEISRSSDSTNKDRESQIRLFDKCLELHAARMLEVSKQRIVNQTYLVVGIMNMIGACVVSGNIRRSSEIAIFSVDDEVGLNLKNLLIYPERIAYYWASNNSCIFEKTEDFEKIPEITTRVSRNGEPGFINLLNAKRFGRVGRRPPRPEEITREHEQDNGTLTNPCGEQILGDKEVCMLVETLLSRCLVNGKFSLERALKAVEYASFYISSVVLVPTHWPCTNKIVAQNRRVGVSMTGVATIYDQIGTTELTKVLRQCYQVVSYNNRKLAKEAGIMESLRKTTNKPSGTLSILAGVTSGIHWPKYKFAIRRMRASRDSEIARILKNAGVYYEADCYSDNTDCFSFAMISDLCRTTSQVTALEKMILLALCQREWSDNAVSTTVEFDKETESHVLSILLGSFARQIKTCSFLPIVPQGAYKQMPYEETDEETCRQIMKTFKGLDFSLIGIKDKTDGECPKYCTNDECSMVN